MNQSIACGQCAARLPSLRLSPLLPGGFAQRLAPAASASSPPAPPEYEAPLTGFADAINTVFQAVDKSRVPSGILEEYGLPFIDHQPFTGSNGFTAANQLDINRWRALLTAFDGVLRDAGRADTRR